MIHLSDGKWHLVEVSVWWAHFCGRDGKFFTVPRVNLRCNGELLPPTRFFKQMVVESERKGFRIDGTRWLVGYDMSRDPLTPRRPQPLCITEQAAAFWLGPVPAADGNPITMHPPQVAQKLMADILASVKT